MAASIDTLQNGQVAQDISTARKINNLLNSSKTRLEGLQMLNLFLRECPDGDFIQFCNSWMQNCCKIDASSKNRDFAVRLLDNLFKISYNYQELKKSVSFFITTRYFDFFFKYFLNSQPGWSCTETCLLLYRGACGPFQEEIEKHLRNEVNKNVRISSTLSECFALIPCIGGGGNEGLLYKKNWRTYFDKFLNVCHSVLNKLFVNIKDIQDNTENTFEDINIQSEVDGEVEFLITQLHNHSAVLNSMLLNEYPAPKNIPADQIFELVCRGLAVNPKAMSKGQTGDVIALQKALPEIHRFLLSLLKAVIITCKSQLLPYSHLICKLIKQSLEWTMSESNHSFDKPFGSLRIAVYETLCNWLAVARSGSCVKSVSGVVVSNAVSDIESKKEVVLLKEAKAQNQFKSREQKTRRVDATANSELCRAALKTLQFLLKFEGVSLKPEEHKFLQEFVVKLLVEVQKSSTFDLVVPFSVSSCRLELYSLLLDLIHQPCPKWPSPTNFALRLFRNGINDSSPEVSAFCSSALNLTTVIIHPQYDNGGFPPSEISDDQPQTEVELDWSKESMEVENEKESETFQEETFERQEEYDLAENMSEDSSVSLNEDSRNTMTKENMAETKKSPLKEETSEKSLSSPEDDEMSITKHKTTEEFEQDKTPSPEKQKTPAKVVPENSSVINMKDPKNVSPESTNENGQTRYFLRSKRKGSSEEPDDSIKRRSSLESLKSTPSKNMARAIPRTKRPRTRALSKAEMNDETESKTENSHDDDENDEEDIKAAFDDSFVD